MTLTQIARKIKNCPKFYKQGGASAPPDTPLPTPMVDGKDVWLFKVHTLTNLNIKWSLFSLLKVFV